MAENKPKYSSLIDAFLDEREPDWKDLGLKEALSSAEDLLGRTHGEVDDDFMKEVLKGAVKNSKAPKEATLATRISDKETAEPRLAAANQATRIAASPEDYKNSVADDSLIDEITMSLDQAEKQGTIEKKTRTDGEIQRWIKTLLNEGVPPAKVAAELNKLAELQLFNKQMSTDYLNSQAGLIGMAYIEPNSFMNKCPDTYERMKVKIGGVRAKSVKQISACEGCTYFKKDASSKTCNLYHLPVVGNQAELSAVINKMTAGVPAKSKKAALVQIANRDAERVTASETSTVLARTASDGNKQAQRTRVIAATFDTADVEKYHVKGAPLAKIYAFASKKFAAIDVSKAIRGFVSGLHKDKGRVTLAKADVEFLKKMGIHNESIIAGAKCASCTKHSQKAVHKAESTEMLSRVASSFVENTPATIRETKKTANYIFTTDTVGKLHDNGHSLEKIFKAASAKVGTPHAKKVVKAFVDNLKNTKHKVVLSQLDCTFLKRKLGVQNAIIGAEKCGSCSYRNGMHCGFTGGTLLSFPGMDKQASNHKVAATAPKDGRAILNEYDLVANVKQADIDMRKDSDYEVE
jgi:hypothetical protein